MDPPPGDDDDLHFGSFLAALSAHRALQAHASRPPAPPADAALPAPKRPLPGPEEPAPAGAPPKRPHVGLLRPPPPPADAAPPAAPGGFVSGKAEANAAAARAGKPLPFPGERGGGGGGGGSRFKPPFAPAEAEGAAAADEKKGLLAKYGGPNGAPLPEHFLGVDLALAETFASDSEFRGKDVDLADVAGLAHVKALLEQALTQPLLMPDLEAHSSLLQTPRALLLFGPPGTGKTMLARAVASKYGFSFFSISASSISSKWQGDSERNVKALWAVAQELAPSIIFL
jgi:hypothetical protein